MAADDAARPRSGAGMQVDLVSAERRLFQGEASAVYARSVEGQIGILPHHEPILLELAPAPLVVEVDGNREVFGVHGGFLEYRGEHLTVLADGADRPGEVDRSQVQRDIDAARQEIERGGEDHDVENARRDLAVAEMRLALSQEHA